MIKKESSQMMNNVRHLITKDNPKSPISEQYRTLRTNIQFSGVDKKIKSLLFTSSEQSAGKSLTAANLANVYAQQGLKTLLIDADMRQPTVHYTFKLDNLIGLSNALIDELSLTNIAVSTGLDNLDVISSGPVPPNPSELLASKQFEMLLNKAYEAYDMVIIDTPPLLAVTDAQILATMVDGVIIVVRSNQTEEAQLKEAVDLIKKVNGRLLGTVLNDVEKTVGNDYYYYG